MGFVDGGRIGSPFVRFTLQNMLMLWAIVAGFCVLNWLLGEWPALDQFLFILGVVFGSGFWALWRITAPFCGHGRTRMPCEPPLKIS